MPLTIAITNFKLLQDDPLITDRIFTQATAISFKLDKTLGSSSVKVFSDPTDIQALQHLSFNFHLNVSFNAMALSGPKGSTKIAERFDCTFYNVI